MAHLTRPAEISGVSAGLFPETAAGNRAYVFVEGLTFGGVLYTEGNLRYKIDGASL